ncbi:putative transcription factor interactor and regulator CCHC(Zn) family protein [Tanacetum coccineum]|uniref:Transcription factor interactor and regulator CCHC(Zn) family protein n=1 Tax=Tanacetum coccineum TaxID=301880 RepID=A0ABQ5EDH7_9ASTR
MCNSMVLTWILNSISAELFAGQVFSKYASVVWADLQETYDKVDGSVTFNLHKSINSLSQNGMHLSDYYHKLNSLWRQFDALTSLPTCSCIAKKEIEKHNQLIKLMQFLMGLDDVYLPIRSNILTRDPLPSVKSAFAIISGEESHRGVASNSTPSKPHATAFVSKGFDNKKLVEVS